jgi:hypothetical protein
MFVPRQHAPTEHGRVTACRTALAVCVALAVLWCTPPAVEAVSVQAQGPGEHDGAASHAGGALAPGFAVGDGDRLPERPDFDVVAMPSDAAGAPIPGWAAGFPRAGGGDGLVTEPMVEYVPSMTPPKAGDGMPPPGHAGSIEKLLRGVVTLRGEAAPGRPGGNAGPRADAGLGGYGFSAMLRPMAAEILEGALERTDLVEGRTVFSVFGGGAFVLEASRNGAGISLAELNTGAKIAVGGDPDSRPAASGSHSRRQDRGESFISAAPEVFETDNSVKSAIGVFAAAFDALVSMATWFGGSPLRLLLLLPFVLLAAAVELTRRGHLQTAVPAVPTLAEAEQRQSPPQGRRRRKRRRRLVHKRGVWRALLAAVRESLGFPSKDRLRETDFKLRRHRRLRRRVHHPA